MRPMMPHPPQHRVEGAVSVDRAVVGHHAPRSDAEPLVEDQGPGHEAAGCAPALSSRRPPVPLPPSSGRREIAPWPLALVAHGPHARHGGSCKQQVRRVLADEVLGLGWREHDECARSARPVGHGLAMAAANALAEQITSPGGQPYVRMLRHGVLFAACLDNLRLGGDLSICHYPVVNNLLVLNT